MYNGLESIMDKSNNKNEKGYKITIEQNLNSEKKCLNLSISFPNCLL